MQNNDYRPASASQLQYLKNLGYSGNVEGLTSGEASQIINNLKTGVNPAPQTQTYQQPVHNVTQVVQSTTNNRMDYNITTRNGDTFMLDKATVETYICANNTKLTEQEYRYFFTICKTLGLNPFLRDAYPIKYGNAPAQFVIDYKVLQQAADEKPVFNGMKTGVLVVNDNGVVSEHEGAYLLPTETLLGAWCEVYRKDRDFPTKTYAMFNEVCKFKDGQPSGTWKEKPVFMNVKVAKAWALREAFPNLFSNNTYTSDELPPRTEVEVLNPEVSRNTKTDVENAQKYGTGNIDPPADIDAEDFNL